MRLSSPPHPTGTLRNRPGIRRRLAGPGAEGRMRLSPGMLVMTVRCCSMRKEATGCRERQGEIDAGNAECDAGQDALDGQSVHAEILDILPLMYSAPENLSTDACSRMLHRHAAPQPSRGGLSEIAPFP